MEEVLAKSMMLADAHFDVVNTTLRNVEVSLQNL